MIVHSSTGKLLATELLDLFIIKHDKIIAISHTTIYELNRNLVYLFVRKWNILIFITSWLWSLIGKYCRDNYKLNIIFNLSIQYLEENFQLIYWTLNKLI